MGTSLPHSDHPRPGPWLRNLPNLITAIRLFLLPGFVTLVLQCRDAARSGQDEWSLRLGATVLLLLIGLGDVLDGALARYLNSVTPLGAILDPLADKLAQVTGLVLFTFFAAPAFPPLPWLLLLLIVGRDLVLLGGTLFLRRRRHLEIRPNRAGKAATLATFCLLVVVCAGRPESLIEPLILASAGLIALSALIYVGRGWRILRRQPAG